MPSSKPTKRPIAKPLKLLRSYTAAFSPDDTTLVTLSNDVVVWDVNSRAKRFRFHPVSHPSHCAFGEDGRHVAVKTTSGRIVTFKSSDGSALIEVANGSEGEGSNLHYSPCSQYLIDGSWKGHLTVRDATNGKIEFQREMAGEMVQAVSRSRSGDRWAVLHSIKLKGDEPKKPDYVSFWKWPFEKPGIFQHFSPFVRACTLSGDGELLATCSQDQNGYRLSIHRAADFEIAGSLHLDNKHYVKKLVWSPDGRELAVVGSDKIVFYRYPEFSIAAEMEIKFAAGVAYSSDGALVAISAWQGGLLMLRKQLAEA